MGKRYGTVEEELPKNAQLPAKGQPLLAWGYAIGQGTGMVAVVVTRKVKRKFLFFYHF